MRSVSSRLPVLWALLALCVLAPLDAFAQVNRAFTPRYSINTTGDIVLVGNTVVTCQGTGAACTAAQNGTGVNNDFTAVHVDIDGDASTFNSSSATLTVPAASNVLWAGLYWSAEKGSISNAPTPSARNTVRFRVPGGTYRTVSAQQFDDPSYAYSGFADVTALVQAAGAGTYTVGNVQVGVGGTNRFGGWSLIVVYENASEPLRNLTVVDGNAVVQGSNKVFITPSGFTTPFSGAFSPRVGVVATDGDNGPGTYTGDSLKVNGVAMTDARNPANNFFNSTISDLGTSVTARSPSYSNTLGFDVDRIAVPSGVIPNGATSAQLKLTTGGETYAVHAVTFATEVYRPNVVVDKTVRDLNGGKVTAGDILEYSVVVRNTGGDNAVGLILSDAIPNSTTYVPGSLVVGTGAGTGPKTDAAGDDVANYDASVPRVVFRLGTGATASAGGTLASNQSTSIVFRVKVNAGVSDGTTIFNSAVADYREGTLGGRAVSTGDAASAVTGLGTDLVVLKSSSAPTVLGGDTFTYTVTYRNDGPDLATGVLVRDALPAGVTYVSSTSPTGWAASTSTSGGATTVNFQRATSVAGEVATFTILVRATAGGLGTTIRNTASVSSETPDVNASNNTAEATTTIVQAVDLRLSKTVDRAAANVGETVTFTVTLANDGPGTATNVAVQESLPAGLALVSATPSTGTFAGDVWTVPTLNSGASATLSVVARVTSAGPSVNTAEVVAADQPDPDSAPNNGKAAEDDQATAAVVGVQADLSVSKTVSAASPLIGQNVTFTVGVVNAGPSAATGVVVRDQLPAGLTFVSASTAQGAYDPATGLWTVGSLPVGGAASLSVVATVTGAGPYTNVAQVAASDQPDPDSTPGNNDPNEDDQASALVGGVFVDLSLQKSVAPSPVFRGETATFTLTVRNDGSAAATGVAVTDALPVGLTFVSASAAQGTYDSATGVWTVGGLAVGASATLDLTVRADADGAITNRAQVSAANEPDIDSAPGNNAGAEDDQAEVVLDVTSRADLRLAKSVSDALPVAGTDVTFTIVLANDGPSAATGVVARDLMPAGLTYVSSTTTSGTYDPATGLWTLGGPVAPGGTQTLTITATVPGTGPYTNMAEVIASDQDDPDSTPGNGLITEDDYGTATVGGRTIDLSLLKSVDAASVPVGGLATFTLTLRNDGSADATAVEVRDLLPAGLTFVSASAAQGTYDASTGLWAVGSLAVGAQTTLDIVARVTAPGAIRNSAEVTVAGQQDLDSVPGNDNGMEDDQSAVVVTGTQSDLSLTKTVDTAAPAVGGAVTFTITVQNAGAADAPDVAVSDRLPAGFSFVSAATSQGSYDASTGVWSVGATPAGVAAVLQITATARPNGPYTNSAQVSASGQPDPDSTPGNDVSSEDDQDSATATPVVPAADLSLTKTVDAPAPHVGDVVAFTLTVRNDGPAAATGVAVTDLLPAGFAYVGSTPSQGAYDPSTGLWTVGTVAPATDATLTITARVTAAGTRTNTAQVSASDQPDPDSAPGNGIVGEDDQAEATVTTVGTSGGGNAGVESEGSMAVLLAQRLYQRREDVAARGMLLAPPVAAAFSASADAGASGAGASASTLRDLVPTGGPQQTAALETTPRDLVGVTNAREVVAADYVRTDGVRLAAMFGATSPGGVLYDHAKATCDRLGGGRLDDVRRLMVGSKAFVLSKLVQGDGTVDYAVSFVAYRIGTRYIVESKFAAAQYAPPAGTEEVLTLQVWSVSPEYTATLVAATLARLEAKGAVEYRNAAAEAAPVPAAYVVSGRYEGGSVLLRVRNTTGRAQTITVKGSLAATESDASTGRRTPFAQAITVPVATASEPEATVRLAVGSLFDGAFTLDAAASMDQFYFADGTWSRSIGSGTILRFATAPETRAATPGTYLVERSSVLEGTVQDYASLFRYLRPAGAPVNLTAYSALEFTYRSTVPVQVLVEKASVTAWGGKFVANLPANPAGTAVRVPFASLVPASAGTARFTAEDVTMVAFYALGDRQSARSFSLALSDVRFTGGATTDGEATPLASALALAQNTPNPAAHATTIRFAVPAAERVTLSVYDLMGREVARLVDGTVEPGAHTAMLDAGSLAAGTYVYRLTTSRGALTRTLVVAR